jgi:hypothetical protein
MAGHTRAFLERPRCRGGILPRTLAAWPSGLGKGLQSPVQRFDSARRLRTGASAQLGFGVPRGVSSAGERLLDKQEVTGSIPVRPTEVEIGCFRCAWVLELPATAFLLLASECLLRSVLRVPAYARRGDRGRGLSIFGLRYLYLFTAHTVESTEAGPLPWSPYPVRRGQLVIRSEGH